MDDKQLTQFYINNLTPRQRDVVYWVSQGLRNEEAAHRLCVQPCVVAGHLTQIYEEIATLDHVETRPSRYTLIRLFAGFFERNPHLRG
jgi:DNA-binding CsgD family transcriptional regulator